MENFGVLNWTILGGYVVGTLVLGFFLSKKVTTDEDYYLGRREMPWWAIGVSVVATYIGALTFLGGPAWSYADGFSVIFIHINYPIAIFIVATVFLPFFYTSGCASIFEYLERRFGVASRSVMSGVFLFGNIAYSGLMLYTAALVIEYITGIDVVTAILIVAFVAVTYTMLGGISAVIWTDVIQTGILFLGAFITLFLLIGALPDGLGATLDTLKTSGKSNPFDWRMDPSVAGTVWSGVIAMSIYHVVVYGVNQMMVQRTLTAKTIGDAKKAYFLMAYVAFFIFVLFFGLGILFYAYYGGREFDNQNLIVLEFVAKMGFPGLMGIVTSAVVAAAMSSLDSSLNSMATVTTLDFYQKFFKKNESPEHYLKATRWFTLFWALFIIIPAIMFTRNTGSVIETLSMIGSFFVGAKLAMYGLGFFSKHTNQKGLLIGVAAGFIGLFLIEKYMDIAWPWYCPIGGAISIAVAWLASILLEGFKSEFHPYTVKGRQKTYKEEGLPEMQDGWYVVPGKIDRAAWPLLVFFVACFVGLWVLYAMI